MTLPVAPPETTLADIAAAVQPQLEDFLDERRDLVEPVGPVFAETTAGLERFVLRGGKRIRPAFAWTGWLAGGGATDGDVARAALRACSALEFVQACALIHDDIIDASQTRRGYPTTHREFAELHAQRGWSGSSEKFGEATAILLGDLALAWADDMFLGAGLSPERYLRAARAWAAMRTEVLGGQLLDIVSEASRDESQAAAERVVRFKTAGYTVERPLHVGAALAGASDQAITALRAIGVDLGVAFQLRDDLLGAFGDPAVTGKPSGDDLRSGKHTPMLAHALATGGDAAEELRALVGTDLDDDGVERARAALRATGAPSAMQSRVEELTSRATTAIDDAPIDDQARPVLAGLAAVLVDRAA
ncbi:Polyprenyl synthetase OS=Tsukamurella paurometabola (strain ATCC 8368 / DSM / CCUG 35730 / CIP 100753 / JCM 10117 / KCTC 9821 / NBRC 16120 / NCIMB 702349/ NCTC 13040) OX=521096 GN=Tpau_2662 PE=3 SV=1 [Tsukamurella paurometabola]|uniref:Polyprenyl synthetase n=1 Tax=Tsukamurella paurometabola (strain ATCC 8368 / DSM 20162 / CCUG 35730 / CIP 100753 / JCM 10117 / KCTC 9821 / NBRC 16120 / NCIMB 702349 / NCTC 13040) TaxID=521096 RepID=D5USJ1_TSUPD|nr:polyprenyl synthetase family protein [Tsukamurella paurometabola]ADG79262.1 Polyprenyl synthetase [Tsukamurella paurometabola DSM 20162]SUP34817.1 Octaprenyl-diphosphate synthase [Tsukamurella paurometabola]